MYDYAFVPTSDCAPWYESRESVRKIIINDGVTSIGKVAFYKMSNLEYAYIPASVETITSNGSSSYAPFNGCSQDAVIFCAATAAQAGWEQYWSGKCSVVYGTDRVTANFWFATDKNAAEINIPNGITTIYEGAFKDYTNLKYISIPSSVTCIEQLAFKGCSSLEMIYIPETVTEIKASKGMYSPFYGCAQKLVIMCGAAARPEGWEVWWNNYTSSDSLAAYYEISLREYQLLSAIDKTAESIQVPEGVTVIPARFFEGQTQINSITLPNSLIAIEIGRAHV